jgi:hypothetical protein
MLLEMPKLFVESYGEDRSLVRAGSGSGLEMASAAWHRD